VDFLSMFFGLTVSRTVAERPPEPDRVKTVSIGASMIVSPHVVDLSTEKRAVASRRPALDFGQRLAVWGHRLQEFFLPRLSSENRYLTFRPEKKPEFVTPRPVARAVVLPARAPMPPRRVLTAEPKFAFGLAMPEHWHRKLFAFVMVAIIVTLPLHAFTVYGGLVKSAETLAAQTHSALDQLKSAGSSAMRLDPDSDEKFTAAASTFAATRERLRGAVVTLAAFATGQDEKLDSGTRLLSAGESLSTAGAKISSAFDALETLSDAPVTDRVAKLSAALEEALPEIDSAVEELSGVDAEVLPKKYRATYGGLLDDLSTIRDEVKRFIGSTDMVMTMLGAHGKRRYLVLFQNDRELRPTGGFIGSFALMDLEDGEIMNMEVPEGGSYDLRGGLRERVAAPDQLRLVNPRWEFQDANWFADFPTSAKSLMWFYERGGGRTVDGVIAVTSSLMEEMLKVIGPIEMAEYGKTITADNFFIETQKSVELEYDKEENKPKQFIADMAPKVLARLMEGGSAKLMPLVNTLSGGLGGKRLQFFFRDSDEQGAASALGWTGELKPIDDADFLAVIDTNIAGGKTDGVIEEEILHESSVDAEGVIVNTVRVKRTHNGKKGELFTGIKNIDYMRVYVPSGSELLEAEGFEAPAAGYFLKDDTVKPSALLAAAEGTTSLHGPSGTRITSESGLTVFGNWVQLEPGESRTVRLTYRLPHRLASLVSSPETRFEKLKDLVGAYAPTAGLRLVVQKQPGTSGRAFTSVTRLSEGWKAVSAVPASAALSPSGSNYSGTLDRDIYLGLIVTKND
jgi:hypothetical protein